MLVVWICRRGTVIYADLISKERLESAVRMLKDTHFTLFLGSFPWKVANDDCVGPSNFSFFHILSRINDAWLPLSKMPTALTRTPLASMMTGTVSCRVVVESPSTVCVLTPFLVAFYFLMSRIFLLLVSLLCLWITHWALESHEEVGDDGQYILRCLHACMHFIHAFRLVETVFRPMSFG